MWNQTVPYKDHFCWTVVMWVMIFSVGYIPTEIEAVSEHSGLKRAAISRCLPLQSKHMHLHNDNSRSRCLYNAPFASDDNLAYNPLHCCCFTWRRANTDRQLLWKSCDLKNRQPLPGLQVNKRYIHSSQGTVIKEKEKKFSVLPEPSIKRTTSRAISPAWESVSCSKV